MDLKLVSILRELTCC